MQPVALTRTRERAAPAVAPTRVREKPRAPQPSDLDPNAYQPHPRQRDRLRLADERREATRARDKPVQPEIPDHWPNGSAMMRGPSSPGYRKHPHIHGEDCEKNPNLIGRSIHTVGRGGYHLWRWRFMKYEYLGVFRDHGEMFAALRK